VNVGSKSVCEVNYATANKAIRLDDTVSSAQYIGVIEIFHNNSWGVICNDGFAAAEGHVACRSLGYSGISNYVRAPIR